MQRKSDQNSLSLWLQKAYELARFNQISESQALLGELLQRYPKDSNIYHLMAQNFLKQRQFSDAIRYVKFAISLNANVPDYFNTLGISYNRIGDFARAFDSFNMAIKYAPKLMSAYINLSSLLIKLKRWEEAQRVLESGELVQPNSHELANNNGNFHFTQGNFQQARDAYSKAIRLAPNRGLYRYNIALTMKNLLLYEQALEEVSNALKIKPQYVKAIILRGEINEHMGLSDAAKENYLAAIEIDNSCAEAYWSLANLRQYQFSLEDAANMVKALPNASQSSAVYFHFALYHYFEQLHDYSRAFTHLRQGNQLKRASFSYNSADNHKFLVRQKQLFNKEHIGIVKGKTNSHLNPLFIIGMPRSGTSLLEFVLAGHSKVTVGGELESAPHVFRHFSEKVGNSLALRDLDFVVDALNEAAKAYENRNIDLVSSTLYFTDKLPYNFSLVGFLATIFPNAHFLHIYKEPLDACFSCFRQLFSGSQLFCYDVEELVAFYTDYRHIMDYWQQCFSDRIINISYEAFVENPSDTVSMLLGELNLQEENLLDLNKSKQLVRTASSGQVRKGINDTYSGRWRFYDKELTRLRELLGKETWV
ncbi:MAG: sulfotransferase [Pseudomonadota bacterium]|nr:sulfotransferase [Pseudomonadota bacterium]